MEGDDERSQQPPTSARRFAVIGGGITGLAAAHRLIELGEASGQPANVTLFEASDRVGGVAGTVRIGDYLVETGADSFITNKPGAIRLCERLGLADRLLKTVPTFRGSHVLRNGKPVPVPDGFNVTPVLPTTLDTFPNASSETKVTEKLVAAVTLPPGTVVTSS